MNLLLRLTLHIFLRLRARALSKCARLIKQQAWLRKDGLSAAILDHHLPDGDCAQLCERLEERGIAFLNYRHKISRSPADGQETSEEKGSAKTK